MKREQAAFVVCIVLFCCKNIAANSEVHEETFVATAHNEEDALNKLKTSIKRKVTALDIETAVQKGWWNLAQEIIAKSHEDDVDLAAVVRSSISSLKKKADELIRRLDKNHNDVQIVSPAFQWAQSPDHVFLNIKFGYRWSSPGALSVDDERVEINATNFFFRGVGEHSHIKKEYQLSLDLYEAVDAENSEWSFGSVGKLSVTLKKATKSYWKRLTLQNKKIANMQVWWELKERYETEMNKFLSERSLEKTNSSIKRANENETDTEAQTNSTEVPEKDDATEQAYEKKDEL